MRSTAHQIGHGSSTSSWSSGFIGPGYNLLQVCTRLGKNRVGKLLKPSTCADLNFPVRISPNESKIRGSLEPHSSIGPSTTVTWPERGDLGSIGDQIHLHRAHALLLLSLSLLLLFCMTKEHCHSCNQNHFHIKIEIIPIVYPVNPSVHYMFLIEP